jgi:hypothetical protein
MNAANHICHWCERPAGYYLVIKLQGAADPEPVKVYVCTACVNIGWTHGAALTAGTAYQPIIYNMDGSIFREQQKTDPKEVMAIDRLPMPVMPRMTDSLKKWKQYQKEIIRITEHNQKEFLKLKQRYNESKK